MGAPAGEAILIGNEPEEYAAHILRLLSDPGERDRIAANGNRFVRSHFDWDQAASRLETLVTATTPVAPR